MTAMTLGSAGAAAAAVGVPGLATLSGEFIEHSTAGTARAAVRVTSDGTMDKQEGFGSYVQIDASTDWVIPNSASSDPDWEVMCAQNSGDALTGGSAALDTWLDPSTSPHWAVEEASDKMTSNANLTISIRWNGGDVIDTGVYTLTAENT